MNKKLFHIDFKNQPPSKGELIQMEKLNYKTNQQ